MSGTSTQPGSPIIGGSVGSAAGGKIKFTLLKANCSTLATGIGTNPQEVSVTGDGTYGPVSFTPDAPGTYHWKAEYIPASGDPNNVGSTHNGSCDDADETVVVAQVPTTLTTHQFVYPQDKAKIAASAGGNLDGSIRFKLYDNQADCLADQNVRYDSGAISISGASPQYATTNNSTVRITQDYTPYWGVAYTSNNPAQLGSSSCEESTDYIFSGDDSTITIP